MSSPLVDWGRSLYKKYQKADGQGVGESKGGADAKMVEEANESFRRKAADGPKLGQKKKGKKKKTAKK